MLSSDDFRAWCSHGRGCGVILVRPARPGRHYVADGGLTSGPFNRLCSTCVSLACVLDLRTFTRLCLTCGCSIGCVGVLVTPRRHDLRVTECGDGDGYLVGPGSLVSAALDIGLQDCSDSDVDVGEFVRRQG